jgi:hypothetical protein
LSLAWDNLETRLRTTTEINIVVQGPEYNHSGPNFKRNIIRINAMQPNYGLRNGHSDLALAKPRRVFLKQNFKFCGAKPLE